MYVRPAADLHNELLRTVIHLVVRSGEDVLDQRGGVPGETMRPILPLGGWFGRLATTHRSEHCLSAGLPLPFTANTVFP